MIHRLPRIAAAFLFAFVMLLAAAAASADTPAAKAEPVAKPDTVQFGSRSLNIPKPVGFERISAASPPIFQFMQAYLPATNRLVEAYVSLPDLNAIIAGKTPELANYFQLQVMRSLDGVTVSDKEFQEVKAQMETIFEKTMKNSQEIASDLARKGNAEIEHATSTNPQLTMSGTEYLGVYRREPWGMFATIKVKGKAAAANDDQTVVGSCAIMLANQQMLALYAYARFHGEDDRRWVQQAVSAWADAVHAAN